MLPPECPMCHRDTTGDLGISTDMEQSFWIRRFRCNHCQHVFSIPWRDPRATESDNSRNGHECRWWLCYKYNACARTCAACQLPAFTRCETCLSGAISGM